MPRAFLVLALGLLWLLSPVAAWGQRVLLVRPPASDTALSEAFNRLRAELQLQDFEVEVLDSNEHPLSPEELEAAAQRLDAFAGVALNRLGTSANADVSIADRVTGKITMRRLAIAGQDSPRILAVRAVDLLRASLRELPIDQRPPPDVIGVSVTPAPPAVRAFTERRTHFQVSAAAAALASTQDISSGYGATLGFWYRPTERLGVGVHVVGPLVGARFRATTGSATLRQELAQVRATFDILSSGRFELGPVLGAGVYHLQAQGEVVPPLNSKTSGVWSFAGSGGIEARLHLTEALALGGSVQGLLLSPRPVVAVDTELEELGQPLLLATVGLGVAF
ncbi:MAG TPA: hypothetical protein VHB79_03805 [Polyangiaceae bacterium]|nr:hypothetical protein [Polyangiaceae bacterium]